MRILGLDIGTYAIKAVELDCAFRRYEIRDYWERKYDPGADPRVALAQLLQDLPRKPDRTSVAIRASLSTFRNLELPTRDKKAIRAGVGFELEDDLPFPSEESLFDYRLLSQTKQHSSIHIGATLKRHVAGFLELLKFGGVDPELITTEAWAYRTFFQHTLSERERKSSFLLIHIGYERTVLYGQSDTIPLLCREISWGGRDLTSTITTHYQIPLYEAERSKIENGFVVPYSQKDTVTHEQLEFSNTLLASLQTLIFEARQALFTLKNAHSETPSRISLSGPSSLLPGLAAVIEESLQMPVSSQRSLSLLGNAGVSYSEATDLSFLTAASVALAQVNPAKEPPINLRKAEYAKRGSSQILPWNQLKAPLIAAGLVFLCFFASFSIQNSMYQSRIAEIDIQLEKSVRSFFNQLSPSAARTSLSNPAQLKTSINQELDKQRSLNRLFSQNSGSPLNFLKNLSATIPRETVVDLIEFQEGASPKSSFLKPAESSASLTFVIQNPRLADKLSQEVARALDQSQKSPLSEMPPAPDSPKRWKIQFTGKPKEFAHGK